MPTGYSLHEYQRKSRTYLKALCRIYLSDYLCLNYSLPMDCQDLASEAQQSLEDYHKLKVQAEFNDELLIGDMIRAILPRTLIEALAPFVCFQAATPECEAIFIHGDSINLGADRHDEL